MLMHMCRKIEKKFRERTERLNRPVYSYEDDKCSELEEREGSDNALLISSMGCWDFKSDHNLFSFHVTCFYVPKNLFFLNHALKSISYYKRLLGLNTAGAL